VAKAEIVLFDLGGVLLPFNRERRVGVMSRELGIEPDAARRFMAGEIHARLDRGQASEAELAAALSHVAGHAVTPARALALMLSVFEAPNAALWAVVAALRNSITVGGFSDNPVVVRELFPAGEVLDPMFWSAELGLTKAEPEAFVTVAERLGLRPAAILFIDDSAANVALAKAVGWDAIQFLSNDQVIEELSARGLAH
jgi:2-haloacid dehalogenase